MKFAKHLSDPKVQERARAARKATKKGGRRAKMAAFTSTFEQQRKEFPKFALPIIAAAEKGSLTAAIKLNCLECSGWIRQEVRDCSRAGCAFYPHRPYQQLQSKNPNNPGGAGMTAALRETIGLPKAASTAARTDS